MQIIPFLIKRTHLAFAVSCKVGVFIKNKAVLGIGYGKGTPFFLKNPCNLPEL